MKSKYKLRHSKDFGIVRIDRKTINHELFLMRTQPNQLGYPRIGLVVSKKLGVAVERNRIKRRLRAAISPSIKSLGAFNIVIIPSIKLLNSSPQELASAINQQFNKIGARLEKETVA